MLTLSVVIPCRDDAENLKQCLQALAKQTVDPIEVIVVDNGCRDESARIAELYGAAVVFEQASGIWAAAAAGYDAAVGDILVRCDADSRPPPDWLARIAAHFAADETLTGLTGPGVFYGLPRYQRALAGILYMRLYFLAVGAALAHWPLFGSNMAIRRSCWCEIRRSVRRYDAQVHDDIDLSFILGPHRKIRYDSNLRVGISPRALCGSRNLMRRFSRAFHTLSVHWKMEAPWHRWQDRLEH
ncbi:glycosyltransferase family 2 protein [Arthrobacter sp. A5]|uniref:glycosyltransferase family 2 protein n=1 Tax=Arthrobacter sp. A5 TaxID=576926 RepID=UPI003DA85CAB